MEKAKELFHVEFCDGVRYSVVKLEEGYQSMVVDPEIKDWHAITQHETLDEAIKFISDWSEEIMRKSNLG
ncbi:hypothetical protein IGK74_002375 [Enterococcus sp. AZ150]|uniref:hypothetical protein n=1 Tax=Enterococcus sp. AZ150 TaxID=2774866 RepID=UPI003F25A30E